MANKREEWVTHNKLGGMRSSALEHEILEEFFVNRENCQLSALPGSGTKLCPGGVSTQRVLALAASSGQKIFSVTQANIEKALPLLVHDNRVLENIRSSVLSGRTVIVPQTVVSFGGWKGAAYAIVDNFSGHGAYLIDGAGNGGYMPPNETGILVPLVFGILATVSAMLIGIGALAPIIVTVGLVLLAIGMWWSNENGHLDRWTKHL